MARRNVLITGANRGLGLEFCRQLLARGDHVIATARKPAQAHELNRLVGEHPGRLHVLPLDVGDVRADVELGRELPLVLGDERLHLLINNAGQLHPGERWPNVPASNFEDTFRTNAMGPYLLVQALHGWLADGATVANLSSQLGSIERCTLFGTPTYNVSKAALNMVTRLLHAALAERRITVVSLHPGWVQTDMGGDGAQIPVETSVAGLLEAIDGLGPDDTGVYRDWRGRTMDW